MGKEWTILDVSTKIYDCCHYVHAHIDAIKVLLEDNSIDPDSIEKVVAKTSEQGKVELVVDDEMERLHPAVFGGVVELDLKNGKRYSHKVIYQKGHPKNPLTAEEYKSKFRAVTK